MRAFVFTDRSLEQQAGRFVWLEIDTEKASNAGLRKRLGVPALPSFFVVNPTDESVALRWVGGATVNQLEKILDDGRLTVARDASGAGEPGTAGGPASGGADPARAADRAFARAEKLYAEGSYAEAARAFDQALKLAPADWSRDARAVESLLFALTSTDGHERAAEVARDAYPRLRRTSSAANIVVSGMDAALSLPSEHPLRRGVLAEMEAHAREVLADPTIPLAADDRSAVHIAVLDARQDAKDPAGAKRAASDWAAYLEREAARAETPDRRTVFDSHRLSAYLELGEGERAISMLQVSERDFPDDYNPPARLALAFKSLKRWDEALAASDRALARVYGPRTLTVLQARADIYVGRGDTKAARRTLEEAVRLAESLPAGQRSESSIASLKKKLAALE